MTNIEFDNPTSQEWLNAANAFLHPPATFSELLTIGMQIAGKTDRRMVSDLIKDINVSANLIDQWKMGRLLPHPDVQEHIIGFLVETIEGHSS